MQHPYLNFISLIHPVTLNSLPNLQMLSLIQNQITGSGYAFILVGKSKTKILPSFGFDCISFRTEIKKSYPAPGMILF